LVKDSPILFLEPVVVILQVTAELNLLAGADEAPRLDWQQGGWLAPSYSSMVLKHQRNHGFRLTQASLNRV